MRVQLLVNPGAGGGTDEDAIREALQRHGATVTDDGPERLVYAGGDGRIGEAAARAAELGVPLAVIPAGTANDFARHLGLPTDLDGAARIAATGTAMRTHELARLNDRPFVNVASAGLAPAAARRADPLKRFLGPLAYAAGAALAGLRDPPVHLIATADGATRFDGDAWQVTVASTGAFGGGAEIDAADPQDGRLDLVVLPARRRIALARHALALRRGTIAEQPGVIHVRADVIELSVAPGTPFNVDGEVEHPGAAMTLSAGTTFRVVAAGP